MTIKRKMVQEKCYIDITKTNNNIKQHEKNDNFKQLTLADEVICLSSGDA